MAYGARLESVLGETPQGFKSPILRHSVGPRIPKVSGGLLVSFATEVQENVWLRLFGSKPTRPLLRRGAPSPIGPVDPLRKAAPAEPVPPVLTG